MLKLRPTSLRIFITSLILIVIIPSVLLTLFSAYEQYKAANEVARQQLAGLAQRVVSEQNQLLAGSRQLLMSLSQLPVVHEVIGDSTHSERCTLQLGNLLSPHPYYRNFGVADAAGKMHCSAMGMPGAVDISDRLYFQRSMANKNFGIGEYQVGRITGQPAINLSYPVTNEQDQITGVVFTALSLDWLGKLAINTHLPAGTSLEIIDSNGRQLSHHSQTASESGESLASTALFRHILEHPGQQVAVLRGDDDIVRFYAYTPLLDQQGGIYVVASLAYDQLTGDVNAQLMRNIIILGLLTVGIIGLALIYSNNFFLKRIRQLIHTAGQLRMGRLETRSGISHADDELGYLAQAFDNMAISLQGHQRELELTSYSMLRSNRALQALSACNRALIHAESEQELLDLMCRVVVENAGYDMAWIGKIIADDAASLEVVAHAGDFGVDLDMLDCSQAQDAPACQPAITALCENRQVIVRASDSEHEVPTVDDRLWPNHTVLVLPLNFDSCRGVMCIYAAENHAFDPQEVRLLQEMVDDITFGIVTLGDRVKRHDAEERVRHLAYNDPLTDLPNRYSLEEHLARLVGNTTEPVAVLMININRFKEINNTVGYSHADELLKQFGPRLSEILPDETFISRTGGDVYAVLLPGCDSASALNMAHQIHRVSKQSFRLADINLNIDVRIGIAVSPEHGDNAITLIRRASLAMHSANKALDRIFLYQTELDQDGPRHLMLAADLRHAIEENDGLLELHFQPKVDLPSGRIVSVEGLCRWTHPEYGPISPLEFIPLAEYTGLITPLTMWVLRTAVEQIHDWREAGMELSIAVNLSARDLYQQELVDQIRHLCKINDVPMHLLEIELTESALMEEPQRCQATLEALHTMGITLYIDDFGTGYSSLSYLKRLPMNAIKIDKSFVMDMLQSSDAEAIVKSTIALAHELGMQVVAEGVEDMSTYNRLADLGCDQAQGYYIARPQSAGQFMVWLEQGAWQLQTLQGGAGKTNSNS